MIRSHSLANFPNIEHSKDIRLSTNIKMCSCKYLNNVE